MPNPDIAAERLNWNLWHNGKFAETVARPSCGNDRPCLMMAGQKNMENSKGGKSYEYSEF